MPDETNKPLKIKSSLIEQLISEGWTEIPEEEARRDFKRHMDNVGPIAEYYKQKERDGLVHARQVAVGYN